MLGGVKLLLLLVQLCYYYYYYYRTASSMVALNAQDRNTKGVGTCCAALFRLIPVAKTVSFPTIDDDEEW